MPDILGYILLAFFLILFGIFFVVIIAILVGTGKSHHKRTDNREVARFPYTYFLKK